VRRIAIVNADDFGRAPGVNRGIARAHEEGIVTSASLMVRYPAAAEAAAYARARPAFSVGLHVDLGEWVRSGDKWREVYGVEPTAAEVERQLEQFRRLLGADPTHLDSHQHVHREEPVRSVVRELGARLGVPVRELTEDVRYVGDFYGEPDDEAISVEGLIRLLRALPEGVTEISCHPGYADGLESSYLRERPREVETLCDPRVREVLAEEGIELRSFENRLVSR
jgi:predicted glycoside hydrolase/deacetylase ChbG (UPF0249 family)